MPSWNEFRERYGCSARYLERTAPRGAYDGWVARANNATFGAQAAYDDLVPGFEALFEREGEDWPRLCAVVKRLAVSSRRPSAQQALKPAGLAPPAFVHTSAPLLLQARHTTETAVPDIHIETQSHAGTGLPRAKSRTNGCGRPSRTTA